MTVHLLYIFGTKTLAVSFVLVILRSGRFPCADLNCPFIIFINLGVNKGIHQVGMIIIFAVFMQDSFGLALFLSKDSSLAYIISAVSMKTHITACK